MYGPPEVITGRLMSGAGAAPMLAASAQYTAAAAAYEASADRLMAMLLDLHRHKRERFVGDAEIHGLYRRIVVERPDMIAAYAERITALVAKLIEQAVARGEWRIDDIGVAAGVVRDAAMVFVHPAFVAQLVTAGAPAEDMLRATVTTLVRAFESGVRYGHLANGRR